MKIIDAIVQSLADGGKNGYQINCDVDRLQGKRIATASLYIGIRDLIDNGDIERYLADNQPRYRLTEQGKHRGHSA